MSNQPIPPSIGEYFAIKGYEYQYHVAATITLKKFLDRKLEWIKLIDSEAKILDDFQIADAKDIHVYQIKYREQEFKYTDLCSNSANPLIMQIAKSYKKIQLDNPEKEIYCHYLTNIDLSNNIQKRIPFDKKNRPNNPTMYSLWNVIRDHLRQDRNIDLKSIPLEWRPAILDMQQKTGLNNEEFFDFLQHFILDYKIEKYERIGKTKINYQINTKNIEEIKSHLFQKVADQQKQSSEQITIQITKEQLLKELGWLIRTELYNSHYFYVDEGHYIPIRKTCNQLLKSLSQIESGYLALLGSPGSGKSTLLTQMLKEQDIRSVVYYSYVPGALDLINLRGEALHFYHDIIIQLRDLGFKASGSLPSDNLKQLCDLFQEQLVSINQAWEINGNLTVILIDGLDHIIREQNPKQSLLNLLPRPDAIPQGVVILLGSQTDLFLPSFIRSHLDNERDLRRIEIDKMTDEEVSQVLHSYENLAKLNYKNEKIIIEKSSGNPLYLNYIIGLIKDLDIQSISKVLDKHPGFSGDIVAYYDSIYNYILKESNNVNIQELLGIICRIRGPIDLSWIRSWYHDTNAIEIIRQKFYFYFDRETDSRWLFHHSSFIQYLNEKSITGDHIADPKKRNTELFRLLANACQKNIITNRYNCDAIYYLWNVEDFQKIIDIGSRDFFKNQYINLRAKYRILEDLLICLQSAGKLFDYVAVSRYIFLVYEYQTLSNYLDEDFIANSLIKLRKEELSIEHIWDGNFCKIDNAKSMIYAVKLLKTNYSKIAKKIFNSSQPYQLISGHKEIDLIDRKTLELLDIWAFSVSYFDDSKDIVNSIINLKIINEDKMLLDKNYKRNEIRRGIQNRLVFQFCSGLIKQDKIENAKKLINDYFRKSKIDFLYQVELLFALVFYYDNKNSNQVKALINQIDILIKNKKISNSIKIKYAFLLKKIKWSKNKIKNIIDTCNPPYLDFLSLNFDQVYKYVSTIFRYYKAYFYIYPNEMPNDIYDKLYSKDQMKESEKKIILAIIDICKLQSEAEEGNILDEGSLEKIIRSSIITFYSSENIQKWREKLYFKEIKPIFYDQCLKTVSMHNRFFVNDLQNIFTDLWQDEVRSQNWPISLRREIILNIWNYTRDTKWVISELDKLEKSMLIEEDLSGRLEQCKDQINAWLEVNKANRAKDLLQRIAEIGTTFEYRKDFQLNIWIKWFEKANLQKEEDIQFQIIFLAHTIFAYNEIAESRAPTEAAYSLLQAIISKYPKYTNDLEDWFLSHEIIDYEDSLWYLIKSLIENNHYDLKLIYFVIKDFLIPISTGDHEKEMRLFIECLYNTSTTEKRKYLLKALVEKIKVYSLRSDSVMLINIIKQFDDDFIMDDKDDKQIKQEKRNSPVVIDFNPTLLILSNGKEIQYSNVKNQCRNFSGFISLLKNESINSYFEWKNIIEEIDLNFNDNEIIGLKDLLKNKEWSCNSVAVLSKRLLEQGRITIAEQIALEVIEIDDPFGWLSIYGTKYKLIASEVLLTISPNNKGELFHRLINDISKNPVNAAAFAIEMDQLFKLILGDDVQYNFIWNEVFNHIQHLAKHLDMPTDNPISEKFEIQSGNEVLCKLILDSFNIQLRSLNQAGQRTCFNLLLDDNLTFQECLLKSDWSNTNLINNLIPVFIAISVEDVTKLKSYIHIFQELADHRDYYVREKVEEILITMGQNINHKEKIITKKQAIYNLHLTDKNTEINNLIANVFGTKTLIDSDLLQIGISFIKYIDNICDKTNVTVENFIHRVSNIYKFLISNVPQKRLNKNQYEVYLRNIGLKFFYPNPSLIFAEEALRIAVTELYDSDLIQLETVKTLKPELDIFEYKGLIIEPQCYPHSFKFIEYNERKNDWEKQIDDSYGYFFKEINGNIVIGEFSVIRSYIDYEIKETRMSTLILGLRDLPINKIDEPILFERVSNIKYNEYINCNENDLPFSIICKSDSIPFGSLMNSWIALKPCFGKYLGWSLSQDGLFKWIDEEGNLMAETRWFRSGPIDLAGRLIRDSVAESYIMSLSKSAQEQLRRKFGKLYMVKKLIRKDHIKNINSHILRQEF